MVNETFALVNLRTAVTPITWSISRCVILATLYFLPISLKAQVKISDNASVTGKYYCGFILPEYSNLTYLVDEKVQSVSLSLSRQTKGKNIWEHVYNFPEYGFTLFYSTLGNDKVHGREVALYPYFALNIISRRKMNFYNQTGIGISYVTRKYDPVDNYSNVAVGSHLNIHFNLKFGINYQLLERTSLHAGLSFEHFSNAKMRNPNLGLNYVTAYSGISYKIGQHHPTRTYEPEPHRSKKVYEVIFSGGSKRPTGISSDSYFTSSATFELKWQLFRAVHFGVGTDIFYDTSTELEMSALEVDGYKHTYDFRTGLHLSQEFMYGRLSLIFQEGLYIGLVDRVKKRTMYNRGIIRYRVAQNCLIQLAMKSHLHVLDYPELGLGYKW
jgi:hypothetical protein